MSNPNALSLAQIASFIADGFVRIDHAFSRAVADEDRSILWTATGCDPDDPASWTRPVIRIAERSDAPFQEAANTPVLHAAFDQLVGRGRDRDSDGAWESLRPNINRRVGIEADGPPDCEEDHKSQPAAAVDLLRELLSRPKLESRQHLQIWHFLRQLGVEPNGVEANRVHGVVLEVHLPGGLDTLAAYADRSARYINHGGRLIVRETRDESIEDPMGGTLIAAGGALMQALVARVDATA